jgi:hypothetical protein
MIKFFRTIRKSFLLEGKAKGYIVYAIGEIVLVVIGILIALSINNWNATNKSNHDKEVIISKIKEEIKGNLKELVAVIELNKNLIEAYKSYSSVYNGKSSEIIISSKEFAKLQKEFPKFFRVKDSVRIDIGSYRYIGETFIELEIPDITSIAWETIRTINIANEFDYECLYQLESLYNLQDRVKGEVDIAVELLQQGEMINLLKKVGIINQIGVQLKSNYEEVLTIIDDCK